MNLTLQPIHPNRKFSHGHSRQATNSMVLYRDELCVGSVLKPNDLGFAWRFRIWNLACNKLRFEFKKGLQIIELTII